MEVVDFTKPDIAGTLKTLSEARVVVSSSLHGLILADSYGIPSLFWNELGEENEWKYRDYFEGAGRQDFVGLTAAEIIAQAAGGKVEALPLSCLAESECRARLDGLREAAKLMPEGSF